MSARSFLAAGVLGLLVFFAACGDGSNGDESSSSVGAPRQGGSSGSGGTAGVSAASAGGAASAGAGSAGMPVSGAAGSSGGSPPDAGAGTGNAIGGMPPSPTDGGTSVYAVECEADSLKCGFPEAHCLGISLFEGGLGYSCSNLCNDAADCSDAPSGAEAQAGCVQFTMAKRCMLVCYDGGLEYSCPDGMSCYRYPESPIGYCLWL